MLVEQRKAEKEVTESDKEKSKEMERREMGKVILCEKENLIDRLLVSICCCIPCSKLAFVSKVILF